MDKISSETVIYELVASLQLCRDMMKSNGLSLPHTDATALRALEMAKDKFGISVESCIR